MKIQIIGTASSGKSTIAQIIKRALVEHGVDVHLDVDEIPSTVPVEKYSDVLSGKRIDIIEIQANRPICE